MTNYLNSRLSKIACLVCLIFLTINLFSQPEIKKRNILSGAFPEDKLKKLVLSRQKWHPYPTINDREEWLKVPENLKKIYIQEAEKHLNETWEILPATLFLEYSRNGNRSRSEKKHFERRQILSLLVTAEIFENKGRFLDAISNAVWAICEESFWGIPAHIGSQKAGTGLPDVEELIVDLFCAETAGMLAWTSYLLADRLDKISPLLKKRITFEVRKRMLDPCMERNFAWMGFENQQVNNWNPWINSNWLFSLLLIETDDNKRISAITRILKSLDNFLNQYPEDGSCDEGPGYWDKAGGALYICLEILKSASNDSISVFNNQLIKNIGSYIYKDHIDGNYFVNTGDAAAIERPMPALLYRYGKSINDDEMKRFAVGIAHNNRFGQKLIADNWGQLGLVVPALLGINEVLSYPAHFPYLRDVWFPGTQLMISRDQAGSPKGMYIAVKGAHNGESHNHNDVGNFVVFYNGLPVLIDVGVESYTAKTFSSKRYEIWTMQSAYHNLPAINGFMQEAGKQFAAKDVKYNVSDAKASLSMDISKAYPTNAGINTWNRKITLNRKKNIEITDNYLLAEVKSNIILNMMTPLKSDLSQKGKIILLSDEPLKNNNPFKTIINFDDSKLAIRIEEIPITDSRLLQSWKEKLYRITLERKNTPLKDEIKISINFVSQ